MHNIVADSLSRDLRIPLKKHELLLSSLFPTQTPASLSVTQDLPVEITCWLESLRAGKPSDKASLPVPVPSKMGILVSGSASWPAVTSTIHVLKDIMNKPNLVYSVRLLQLCEEMSMAKEISVSCQEKQFDRQSIMYVRPLGQTFTLAPFWKPMEKTPS